MTSQSGRAPLSGRGRGRGRQGRGRTGSLASTASRRDGFSAAQSNNNNNPPAPIVVVATDNLHAVVPVIAHQLGTLQASLDELKSLYLQRMTTMEENLKQHITDLVRTEMQALISQLVSGGAANNNEETGDSVTAGSEVSNTARDIEVGWTDPQFSYRITTNFDSVQAMVDEWHGYEGSVSREMLGEDGIQGMEQAHKASWRRHWNNSEKQTLSRLRAVIKAIENLVSREDRPLSLPQSIAVVDKIFVDGGKTLTRLDINLKKPDSGIVAIKPRKRKAALDTPTDESLPV